MTSVTLSPRQRRSSRLLGSSIGELTLRVLSEEHQGREVHIRSPKCTIGAAPGCTLRLAARGVRPLHCWILRGAGGTIVRRRDPNTRLNGRPFADAPLMAGDRLRIGPVELEVVQCPNVPIEWTCQSAELPELPPANDFNYAAHQASLESAQAVERLKEEQHNLERQAAHQLGELNDLISRVTAERDGLSERLARLESESASERNDLAQRLRTAEAEAGRVREQLAQRLRAIEAEGASERDALLLEKQQLELSIASSQQQLAQLQGRLTSREAEIESALLDKSRQAAELQGRLEQAVRDRASLETQLTQQTDSLRAESQSRQAERDRLHEECQRLQTQLAQLRELIGYTAAERDSLTVRLDGQQQHRADQEQLIVQEKADLQRRLDATLAQLAEADRRLAVRQVEGDNHLRTEMEQVSALRQRLDQTEQEKSELESRLAEQTATWHGERESLRQQTERVSGHCKQVEGQLVHVRELVESLASERDSLCQQLESTEIKLAAEQQQWHEQRTLLEQQTRGLTDQDGDRRRERDELTARLEAEVARAAQWQRRAEETEQQLAAAGQQLTEATERFSSLRAESEGRLHDESGLAARLAQEADQTREQLTVTQVALADAETRLVALRAEIEQRLHSEDERIAAAEQRGEELARELAAADVRLADAERKLSAFRREGDARLNIESQKSSECEHKLAEAIEELTRLRERAAASESQCLSLRAELAAQEAAQQHSKETSAGRWELLQEQLASSQSRLAALQAEHETRLQAETARASECQRQAAESLQQLDAARGRLAEAETRLAELESQNAGRLAAESAPASDWERRAGESEASRLQAEARLLEQAEVVRFERESWLADRERLHQECRMLGHRLIEKQKEVDELAEQARAAAQAPSPGPMTVPFADIQEVLAKDDERIAWNAERELLELRLAELQQQLAEQKQFSQGKTLGSEAIAELRTQAQADQATAEAGELRTQLAAIQGELAEALGWRDRFQEADSQVQQQRAEAERLAREVEQLQLQIAAAVSAEQPAPTSSETLVTDAPDGEQLAQLQALYDQQTAVACRQRELAEERTFLEAARQELAKERDDFKQTQTEFETQWRQWEDSLRNKEQLLNRQAEELTDRLERAAARVAEVESQRTQLAEQQAALDQQGAELASRAVPAPVAEPAAEIAASEPVSEQLVAAQPPVTEDCQSTMAVQVDGELSRKLSAELENEVGPDAEQLPDPDALTPPPTAEKPKPVWTQPELPARAADDDSIEAYMARLLRRVRGDAPLSEQRFIPPVTSQAHTATASSQANEPAPTATVEMLIEPVTAAGPADFMPRNKAPELMSSMAAMRELANSAARTAIVKHARKSGGKLALAKSIGAVLTLVCSLVAAYFAYRTNSLYASIGAAVGGLAACYWGSKALRHAIHAMLLQVPVVKSIAMPVPAPARNPVEAGEPAIIVDADAPAGTDTAAEPSAVKAEDNDAQAGAN